jgi:hypothetical protein
VYTLCQTGNLTGTVRSSSSSSFFTRREIDSALLDRDRVLKENHELREKLGEREKSTGQRREKNKKSAKVKSGSGRTSIIFRDWHAGLANPEPDPDLYTFRENINVNFRFNPSCDPSHRSQ